MLLNIDKSRLFPLEESQNTDYLARVWDSISFNSCPHEYNFHLHTTASDGQLSPESLVLQTIAIGLKGFAITDHHSVNGFYQAEKYLQAKSRENPKADYPYLWSGIEISAVLEGTDVHILGYGFNPQSESLQKYLTGESPKGEDAKAKNVIKTLHQSGGLVVLAHPHRYRRKALELITLAYELGIDGVEAYYAYGNPHPWQPSEKQTRTTITLAKKYGLHTTCGTDTHGTNILVRL